MVSSEAVLSMAASKLFAEPFARPSDTQAPALSWLPLTSSHLEVNGLPWFAENGGELSRLPISHKESYRKAVWNLAQDPSGGRVRFVTNSSALAIRLEYPHGPNMKNMQAFGQTGVDLYLHKKYWGTAIADKDSKPGFVQEHVFYKEQARVDREVTLYLPLYVPVKIVGVGVDADSTFKAPSPFALPKPIVFYGTSITQGACASRSGLTYEAIVARALNADFVNLGFSGNGIGEPALASTVASLDASAFVLDFAHNNPSFESFKKAYDPFIAAIRKAHPQTPIFLMTPIYDAHMQSWAPNNRLEQMGALIREIAARRISEGDKNLQVIEGSDLLGPTAGDSLVDGTHPNDLGIRAMAQTLQVRIGKVLGLKPIE